MKRSAVKSSKLSTSVDRALVRNITTSAAVKTIRQLILCAMNVSRIVVAAIPNISADAV